MISPNSWPWLENLVVVTFTTIIESKDRGTYIFIAKGWESIPTTVEALLILKQASAPTFIYRGVWSAWPLTRGVRLFLTFILMGNLILIIVPLETNTRIRSCSISYVGNKNISFYDDKLLYNDLIEVSLPSSVVNITQK